MTCGVQLLALRPPRHRHLWGCSRSRLRTPGRSQTSHAPDARRPPAGCWNWLRSRARAVCFQHLPVPKTWWTPTLLPTGWKNSHQNGGVVSHVAADARSRHHADRPETVRLNQKQSPQFTCSTPWRCPRSRHLTSR
jgi:hypothetical protein